MNGHSANNGRIMATELTTPAVMARNEISTYYMYARGDASGQYASDRWTSAGYANNNAKTFIRDFLYLKPDLVAFADALWYSGATTSPTTWIARFAGKPAIDSQRFTSTYGGQKIVQDVVLPLGARFSVIDEISEIPISTTSIRNHAFESRRPRARRPLRNGVSRLFSSWIHRPHLLL